MHPRRPRTTGPNPRRTPKGVPARRSHLFPPTTNLYDPKVTEPKTLALPPIWKNFDNFYALATAASKAAADLSETQDKAAMKTASLRLRASCDSCHALFLRPYVPPKVLDSDLQFDFDSALRKKR